MTSILYNALMAVMDALFAFVLRRDKRPAVARLSFLLINLAAVAFAGALGEDGFGVLRLLAYGLFLHVPIQLALFAALQWKGARKTAVAAMVLAALDGLVALDAFLIEPTWLEVSHVTIASPKIKRPIRIVVLADLQTDAIGDYERRVLRTVMEQKPDLILLAGDYLQERGGKLAELRALLRDAMREVRFGAPLGAFAVEGNVDNEGWPLNFQGFDVKCFVASGSIEIEGLRITGLSLGDSFNAGLQVPAADAFHIVFGHGPDFALGDVRADLLVAGHTHGGQVQIPLFGPPITFSQVPRSWASGVTNLGDGRTLVVSRGTGMERGHAPRLRFLCRPEIVVIDLQPQT